MLIFCFIMTKTGRVKSNLISDWLILGILYALGGKIGLRLAIAPGFATAVWPPSGIALAYLLLRGNRCWPGIILGSFILNLSVSLKHNASFSSTFGVPA